MNDKNQNKGKNLTLKAVSCLLVLVFFSMTAGLGYYGFVAKDREFSESENRVLASVPALTLNSIISGSFMKDFEAYLADQFPFRDEAISLKTLADRLIGKNEENGVYIGFENYLFDSQVNYDAAEQKQKLSVIDEFSSRYPDAKQLIAIAPNSSYFNSQYLPEHLELPDQYEQIKDIYASLKSENLKKVNVTGILQKEKDEAVQFYYKTDHHWTTRAAYSVFDFIGKYWKLDTNNVNYLFYPVTTEFEGTLASKSGVHDVTDTVEICIPAYSKGSYVVNYEAQQNKKSTLFDEEKLSEKNKYEVFLGGNFDKVIISTTVDNRDCLLIVKDSYANCMIPMLTPYFSKIVVVDPRYLTENMADVMSDYDFTHILFLYNLNTFLEDTSIVTVFSES